MIHLLVALSPAAAATWTVTRTDDLSVSGTLRYALTHAAANDTITFSTTQFPPGSVTTVTLTQALPTLGLSGLVLDGGGRAKIACAATMANGSGLLITGADVTVRDLVVADCPQHGIQVTALRTVVERTELRGNDAFGILVVGADTAVADVELAENTLVGNCAATTATCAGIGVRRGGVGAGPHAVSIHNNTIDGTSSGGHGIALLGGVDHLVATNEIGLGGGNAGHGVLCAANSGQWADATIVWNTIGHNAQNGIQLGLRCEPSQVGTNWIGVDGVTDVGNGLAGIELFGSDGHHLLGNVVGFNTTGGVLVNGTLNGNPAEDAILEDNLVGLCADGVTPAPNTGDGIRLDGPAGTFVDHLLDGNVVGSNTGHGVRVDARGVTLHGNLVGVATDGSAQGNDGSGVYAGASGDDLLVDGCPTPATCTPNVIGANGSSGLQVYGSDAQLLDNVVGWSPDGLTARGNGGDGVWLGGGADRAAVRRNVVGNNGGDGLRVDPMGGTVSNVVLRANTVNDNVGRGISAAMGASTVTWSENEIADNGSCPYRLHASVNGAVDDVRPVITFVTSVSVQGTFSAAGSGRTLDRIELFVDDGTEMGRYLGVVPAFVGTAWRFDLGDAEPMIPTAGRVTAIAVFTSGEASHPEEWCQDGCDVPGPASCNDGSPCTTDTCQANGCAHSAANTGTLCDDGNRCTIGETCSANGICSAAAATFAAEGTTCNDQDACSWNSTCNALGACVASSTIKCDDGNSCTADDDACSQVEGCDASVDRPAGYQCEDGNLCNTGDTCDGSGTCVSGPAPWSCPEQTLCNTCSCDPDSGCVCEGIPNDGFCGPDDLDTIDGELVWDDCDDGDPLGWDLDGDGLPNLWETNGADLNCDGVVDIQPDEFRVRIPDLFWEIDHLAPGADGHTHDVPDLDVVLSPRAGELGSRFTTAFVDQGIRLHADVGGLPVPHFEVTTLADDDYPRFGSPTWVPLRQVMATHFDYGRRGVYSYALFVHESNEVGSKQAGVGYILGDRALIEGGGVGNFAALGLLLHEKGHNLGLRHGGYQDRNFKINYLSSMNYRNDSGMLDVRANRWRNDLSWYERPGVPIPNGVTVDIVENVREDDLVEDDALYTRTVPVQRLYRVTWACPPLQLPWGPSLREVGHAPVHADVPGPLTADDRRIDWNCNGVYGQSGYALDLNGEDGVETTVMKSHWDWGHLDYGFQRSSSFHGPRVGRQADQDRPLGDAWRPVRGVLYPGCATAQVPRQSPSAIAPLVLFGSATLDAGQVSTAAVGGATPLTVDRADYDGDGFEDWFGRFAVADLVGLDPAAVHAFVTGVEADGSLLLADLPITRPVAPADVDGDGVHDACDDCPTLGDPPGGWVDPFGCPP